MKTQTLAKQVAQLHSNFFQLRFIFFLSKHVQLQELYIQKIFSIIGQLHGFPRAPKTNVTNLNIDLGVNKGF